MYRVWKEGTDYPVVDLIALPSEEIKVGDVVTGVNLNNSNDRYTLKINQV